MKTRGNRPDLTLELSKAEHIMSQHFDETVLTADDAFEILMNHGVNPGIAQGLVQDMFPE